MYVGKLKDFQKEGAEFFIKNKHALLAFEMGLGKTHIAMASIEEEKIFPALILCPNYIKWKWADEIETWTNHSPVIIDGSPKKRYNLYSLLQENTPYYVILNYELLRQDIDIIKQLFFKVIVADEVTAIKTYNSKTKRAIKKLMFPEYKLGLTGTPVSNRPDEIYSIMDWIEPKLYGNWYHFDKHFIRRGHFNQVESYINLSELATISSTRMLSKKQDEVSEQLPKVVVENIRIPATPKQWSAYRHIASSLKTFLDYMVSDILENGDEEDLVKALIRQRFSALRQVSVCPKILEDSQSKYVEELALNFDDLGGKIPAAVKLIEEASGKIVVFSFFRGVVDILDEILTERGIPHLVIKGGQGAKDIYEVVKKFQTGNFKVLLTTEAGDKGIDLQCANHLINMDIPFSWEKYDQRIGRIKRIGSVHNTVFIYNLMTRNSFEERMLNNVTNKGLLADAIQGKIKIDTVIPTEISLREFLGTTL
jgi:SNF2 family DNA or RNA helicase